MAWTRANVTYLELPHTRICVTICHRIQVRGVLTFLFEFPDFNNFCRRDRGFVAEVPSRYGATNDDFYYYQYKKYFETGEIVFTYIIPSILHLSGFLAAIYVYRIADNELLQSLIERVFILSNTPRHLVIHFWIYKSIALAWLGLSITYITFIGMEQPGIARNHYIKLSYVVDTQGILKVSCNGDSSLVSFLIPFTLGYLICLSAVPWPHSSGNYLQL